MSVSDEAVARMVGALREELRGYSLRLARAEAAGDDGVVGVLRERCAGVERELVKFGAGEITQVEKRPARAAEKRVKAESRG